MYLGWFYFNGFMGLVWVCVPYGDPVAFPPPPTPPFSSRGRPHLLIPRPRASLLRRRLAPPASDRRRFGPRRPPRRPLQLSPSPRNRRRSGTSSLQLRCVAAVELAAAAAGVRPHRRRLPFLLPLRPPVLLTAGARVFSFARDCVACRIPTAQWTPTSSRPSPTSAAADCCCRWCSPPPPSSGFAAAAGEELRLSSYHLGEFPRVP
jgi:hypothetical protein